MQYEECSFEEATHARLAGGNVVELDPCINTDFRTWKGFPIDLDEQEFQDLGITPLRMVEVKPIEFVANFYQLGEFWYPAHKSGNGASTWIVPRKRFKCVEILEDEQ